MIRAGFKAQMADGKPQMAGTGQMAADGRWQAQMADGRIFAIWNRAESETWCSWQMADRIRPRSLPSANNSLFSIP
jgi:hypothetical protein